MSVKKRLWIYAGIFCLCALFVLWVFRVRYVNSQYKITQQVYEAGDSFTEGDWCVSIGQGLLMAGSAFQREYADGLSGDFDGYQVGVKLHVEYLPEKLPSVDEIVTAFACKGFRTATWYNGMDPFFFAELNQEEIQRLCETGEGDLILETRIDAMRMTSKHYAHVEKLDFYYVYSVYPEQIMIHIKP